MKSTLPPNDWTELVGPIIGGESRLMKIIQYRYYCQTESKNVYELRDSTEAVPTLCKNDHAHTIASPIINSYYDNVPAQDSNSRLITHALATPESDNISEYWIRFNNGRS